ncbi:MAG: Z1 domain-containing protein [Herpetosiphonaceae bacterium]|nr:Z1 domain-containing protein [Herpetosiphonaceae bacterium]
MIEENNPILQMFIDSRQLPDDVRKNLLAMGVAEAAVQQAYNEFRRFTGRRKWLTPPPMLVGNRNEETNWYPGADKITGARFWPKLKEHLLDKKRWTLEAIGSIDDASDKIVSWLDSPWAANIQTRGLVVGYVQSGKTANFTAVIAKAADAGYRFFIVLSGTKTNLRSQTQQRLDRELVQLNRDRWHGPPNDSDFDLTGNVDFYLSATEKDHRVLFVVKKNTKVLQKLIKWLGGASPNLRDRCPFLIIDDEADEASVNTARYQANATPETTGRTAINKHLIKLLALLPKAAYIGYTATPFANVLIDPRPGDLYPRDFIVALPKPADHFATEQIFGRERLVDETTDEEFFGIDMLRDVPTEEVPLLRPVGKDPAFIPMVTPSLQDALHYFWMATAGRFARGQSDQHATMLVHTTQSVPVHVNTTDQIRMYRQRILAELHGSQRVALLQTWQIQWDDEQEKVDPTVFGQQPIPFTALLPYLDTVVEQTIEVTDNSQSRARLSFDQPPKIQIAVGGNTLSRGLTLEGLLVSFFVRAAGAYDTLLQMGRWFGYRRDYGDLPRMWMTSELEGQFRDLATIEAEIRQDIARYAQQRMTPAEFGVRIRTHPALSVTAALKMQHAVAAHVSFGGKHHQTTMFEHKNSKWLQTNIGATERFIEALLAMGLVPEEKNGHTVFYKVPAKEVIKFIGEYQFHPNMTPLQSGPLRAYIRAQQVHGKLYDWNIVIRSLQREKKLGTIKLGGITVPLVERARRKEPSDYAHIGSLMSKGDVALDLRRSDKELRGKQTPDLINLRAQDMPDIGLLVIYPIAHDSKPTQKASIATRRPLDAVADVIGLGFVFPEPAGPSRGEQDYVTVDPAKLIGTDVEWDEADEDEAL